MARSFFGRNGDGQLEFRLPEELAEVIVLVFADLASFLEAPPPGEVSDRLFPRAYLDPTEEHAEQEWREIVHDDLVREKAEAAEALVRDLQDAPRSGGEVVCTIPDEQAETRWVMALNDARLTIGTALGITADGPPDYPPDDPRASTIAVYELLEALQYDLVEALVAELPEEGTA